MVRICLSLIVDTLMMMHVEFNSDLLFVASEHAGLHVRSLVPDFSRLFLLCLLGRQFVGPGNFLLSCGCTSNYYGTSFSFSEHAGLHR